MEKHKLAKIFGQVLREIRNSKNLSQEDLADRSELDRTYISMLERGIKTPTIQTIFQICLSIDVNPSLVVQKLQQASKNETKPLRKNHELPLFATAISCGKPVGNDHSIEKILSLENLIIKNPRETFFARAIGESMFPTIQEDDYLVVDKGLNVKSGNITLVQIDNEFTIKRYFKEQKTIILKCDNPSFKDILITEDTDFFLCGVVTSIIRQNL
jgi:SOS-response transcriptional repressor LexA